MLQQLPPADEALLPYRRLAIQVLGRALRDLLNPDASAADHQSAHTFLSGSPMLVYWCRVAALDPRRAAAQFARLTADGHDRGKMPRLESVHERVRER